MPEPATPDLGTCPEDVYTMGFQSSIQNKEKDLQMLTYMLRWRRHIMWMILSSSICAGTQGRSIPPKQLGRTPTKWTSVAVPGVGFQDDLPLPFCMSAFPLATNIYYTNNLQTCVHGLKTVFPQLSSSEATNKVVTLLFTNIHKLHILGHQPSKRPGTDLHDLVFPIYVSSFSYYLLPRPLGPDCYNNTELIPSLWMSCISAGTLTLSIQQGLFTFRIWHRCYLFSRLGQASQSLNSQSTLKHTTGAAAG